MSNSRVKGLILQSSFPVYFNFILVILVSLMTLYQMVTLHNLRSLCNDTVVVNELRSSNEVTEARCRVYANMDK